MRIAFAQINPTVGDVAGNAELILDHVRDAEDKNCDLTIFPELVLTGYPPEDLLFKPSFIKDNLTAINDLSRLVKKTTALVSYVDRHDGKLFNAIAARIDSAIS